MAQGESHAGGRVRRAVLGAARTVAARASRAVPARSDARTLTVPAEAGTRVLAAATRRTGGSATRSTAKKSTAKQTTAKQTAAKKTAAKKSTATQAPAKKTTAKKTTAKKSTAKKSAAKAPAKSTAKKSAARTPAHRLAVRHDESPWTRAELSEVRTELEDEVRRLREELDLAEHEIDDMLRDGGDGAGDDPADAGSKTFEREHEMSLANNTRDMLVQAERALARIDNGTYGICENCGNPIGKARLQVFPRATLCMTCKTREERR
jgi:RNA polymerase-binding protein DksA